MSKEYHEPYLCGGLFLTQLLRFVDRSTTANDRIRSINEPKKNPNVLKALISTYWMSSADGLKKDSLSTSTTRFAQCKENLEELAKFNNPDKRKDFDADVKAGANLSLTYMKMFVESFLTLETDVQKSRIIKIFLRIIQEDRSIDPEQEFYITGAKNPVNKNDLPHQKLFYVDAFLLGIWHFIIMKRCDKNNSTKAEDCITAVNNEYNDWLDSYPLPKDVPIELFTLESTEDADKEENADDTPKVDSTSSNEGTNAPQPVITQFVKEQYVLPPNQPFIKANYIGSINYYGDSKEDDNGNQRI